MQLRAGKIYIPTQGPLRRILQRGRGCHGGGGENTGAPSGKMSFFEYDNKAPFTPVGGGSDGTTASAWVIKEKACKACKQLVLEAALAPAALMDEWARSPFPPGTKPEDLDTADSKVFLKSDPSKSIPFSRSQHPWR